MHLNSEKYFHYSQIYNKQVSYGLSIEKAEETLGDFCRHLSQFDLSRTDELYDKLNFLRSEIENIVTFCSSRQIKLIQYLIELQFNIFCKNNRSIESNVDELLQSARILIDDLPLTLPHKKWEVVLDYLCFEYYYSIGSTKLAHQYFEKTETQSSNLLLYNHVGLVPRFLISKIKFCIEFNRMDCISSVLDLNKILIDPNDKYTQIVIRMYNAMVCFFKKEYKEAVSILNGIQNEFVFKDYFHGFLNIKLILLFFYIALGEFEKAQTVIIMLTRRIKIENQSQYNHVLYLIKAFDLEINKEMTSKNLIKHRDYMILFISGNNKYNRYEVIPCLVSELRRKHQI